MLISMAALSLETQTFRTFLVELGEHLKQDELEQLKSWFRDVIPGKYREKIKTTTELFEKLEEVNVLSVNNLADLTNALESVCKGNKAALSLLRTYEARIHISGETDFNQEIVFFLKENLGREYKDFLRRLGLQDSYIDQLEKETHTDIKEVIHKAMLMWLQKHKSLDADEVKKKIKTALQKIRRNDLKEKMDSL